MITLKYGNTNTFFIPGERGGLLVDTDYAGTLQSFFRAIKISGLSIKDIVFVMATHYHPDHMGLISELMEKGVRLLLMDEQRAFIHFSDGIFRRDGISCRPIDDTRARVVPCAGSRAFLAQLGLSGEVAHTPSHSADSVTLVMDNGDCFAGDLEPPEYIEAYGEGSPLSRDWARVMALRPKRLLFAHRPERKLI